MELELKQSSQEVEAQGWAPAQGDGGLGEVLLERGSEIVEEVNEERWLRQSPAQRNGNAPQAQTVAAQYLALVVSSGCV
jgi:hypothetical protein